MNILTRAKVGASAVRDYDEPCVSCVTVLPSSNSVTALQQQTSIARANGMGVDYVRTTSELYQIAPNRATRTYTYLDRNLDAAAALGLGVMLELTEGVENGDWNSTSRKSYVNFSATDKPYWEALLYDVITRAIGKVGANKLAVTLLNEPDNTNFGASVNGQLTAMHMNVLDWMATFVRSNFPDLVLIGPSLSYFTNSTMTWDVISDTYFCANGRLRPAWSCIDYFDFHLYPNGDVRLPPPGPGEVFHFTRQMIDSGINQLLALTGGSRFAAMRYLVSETNRSFTNGQTTTRWTYGSDQALADLFDTQLDALHFDERIWMASVYYVQNTDVAYDSKSNATHHGLYRYDESATKRLKRFTNKLGNAFDPSAVTATDL